LGGGLRKGGVVVDNNLQLPLMRTQVPVNLAANHPHLPPTSCGCRLSVSFGMLSVLVSGGLGAKKLLACGCPAPSSQLSSQPNAAN